MCNGFLQAAGEESCSDLWAQAEFFMLLQGKSVAAPSRHSVLVLGHSSGSQQHSASCCLVSLPAWQNILGQLLELHPQVGGQRGQVLRAPLVSR